MNDLNIIELLWERSEAALDEISDQYSRLYKSVLREILGDDSDTEECANDLLLAVWNSIPPNRPDSLPAYICKLARRIGIDRLRYSTRQKRNGGYTIALSELEECLPDGEPADDSREQSQRIREVLTEFLKALDPETQILFIRRYVYLESVTDLAKRFEMKENRISARLYRARLKLKRMLEKEGITL
ncbi:MAG: sigma-70 family RNA polymerase sigma factor [Clostridia bacterium]|nr:sigma-70 family RNA polymerase sigma factor [Clostridia bacterium]